MINPIFSKENEKRYDGIEFLSKPSDCFMADEWFEFAQGDHFWIQWRFDSIRKLLPSSYDWGKAFDIGCGNAVVRSQIEQYYGCTVDGCDLNLSALREALPGQGSLYFYNVHEQQECFREKFKTICLLDVLEHIKDAVGFLDSVKAHLRKDGRVIINVPAFQFFYSAYDEVQGHVKRYNFSLLQEELQAAGFIIEKGMYWGMSMVPIIFLRKFIVKFIPKKKIMSVGFQPQNLFINFIFQSLRRLECAIFTRVPFGTSLMVIARKQK